MRPEDILVPTPAGVCCKLGGFHIDPTRPVERALITHAHSDHARAGHGAVLATQETLDLMRLRYGDNFAGTTQAAAYGESVALGGAKVTFHPAGHVLGSAQIAVEADGLRVVASGDYKNVADPTCAPFELVPCDVFITEATFALPVFRHGDPGGEIAKLIRSVALFPERAHLVGAYSLGKAQRVIALLRQAGYDVPLYLHGAMEKITRYYESRGIALGELRLVSGTTKQNLAGTITICPPSALNDLWTRRFPDPLAAFASGWMRVRARARQQGVSLPLVISDHADWDGLTATIAATGAGEIWVTHGQEDASGALVRHARAQSAAARHRRLWRRGRSRRARRRRGGGMNRFAELLDRLAYEPSRNNKLRLITDYFRSTPDPERGWALAALTGTLSFPHAKAGLIRSLIAERTDPVLFELSYDFVGDLSETVALMWPTPLAQRTPSPLVGEGWGRGSGGEVAIVDICESPLDPHPYPSPQGGGEITLTAVIETLSTLGKAQLPQQLARWLDALDETGRWALIKLVTGGLRIGVSARLAKTAVAALSGTDAQDIELLWPGLSPPYEELFAWLEGRADKPASSDPAPFRPPMLAHALDDADLNGLEAGDFMAEWKWDGIRVQAVAARHDCATIARLYSRTGEDISKSFPDLLDALHLPGAIDGELLIMRDRRVQSFNVLQQRLNRKTVTPKLIAEFPAHLRAYDLLADGNEDLRERPFVERRARLESFVTRINDERVDLSPLVPFTTWDELTAARKNPAAAGGGEDAAAVEGVMLKRRDALYLPGRPKGPWWKWKRDPFIIDAVLMYAQRGHGKRSSYYSDYTFGVWTRGDGVDELVPVGKAYFGFTDEELLQIDRFVRRNTTDRFGPVREVVHERDQGLVLEVAFEGLQRSTRHKSGLAMRFPRINRLRWDKPPGEADRLERLETMIARIEQGRVA